MTFWARVGANIGLFFHTLLNLHRSQIQTDHITFHDPATPPWYRWIYECADCKAFRVTVESPAWETKDEEKQKTEAAPEAQQEEKEPFHGHYKRRDETYH